MIGFHDDFKKFSFFFSHDLGKFIVAFGIGYCIKFLETLPGLTVFSVEIRHFRSKIWRITKDKYEKKRKEYRAKQKEINGKTAKLHFADEEYYLTSEYLLKLASNASKLFESSEVHEKRLLLKMTLQNLELKGKIARYDWTNPFDKIAFYASRQAWLRNPSINRTGAFDCIIKAFQNPIWAEQARERLKQIKMLTLASVVSSR